MDISVCNFCPFSEQMYERNNKNNASSCRPLKYMYNIENVTILFKKFQTMFITKSKKTHKKEQRKNVYQKMCA